MDDTVPLCRFDGRLSIGQAAGERALTTDAMHDEERDDSDMILAGDRFRVGRRSPTSPRIRGGSSVGQSSGLIIRRSQVQVLPAPPAFPHVRDYVATLGCRRNRLESAENPRESVSAVRPVRSTASPARLGIGGPSDPRVWVAVPCPSCCWIILTPAPDAIISDAAVCGRLWTRSIGGTKPTNLAAGINVRRFQFVTRSGPPSRWGNANPSRPTMAPRPDCSQQPSRCPHGGSERSPQVSRSR